jgi:predicted DNA-binding protein
LSNSYSRSKAYVSFQVRISPELKEQLARRSYTTGVSQGAIVASALKHYLAEDREPQDEEYDEGCTEKTNDT